MIEQIGRSLCVVRQWRAGVLRAVLILAAGAGVATAAQAQSNAIESVSSSQQGASTVLSIRMKSPPSVAPASFVVANPPRLALDEINKKFTNQKVN